MAETDKGGLFKWGEGEAQGLKKSAQFWDRGLKHELRAAECGKERSPLKLGARALYVAERPVVR